MKLKATIVSAETVKGVSKRTQAPYEMVTVTGVTELNGQQSIFRGILPRDSKEPQKGACELDLELSINPQSLQFEAVIKSITPNRANP